MTHTIGLRVPSQHVAAEGLAAIFDASTDSTALKLGNPAMWTPRQDLSRLLFRHELFKLQLNVQGSIVECGVGHGGGLLAWLNFSAIHEPVNHQRTVIGFDTFAGFPSLSEQDALSTSDEAHPGGLAVDSYDQITAASHFHNANRPLPNVTKLELVKGDALETIPAYIDAHPHLLVSLLYLDFDLYEPTRVALRHFLPRMPAGALLAFDELNIPDWPGETQALLHQEFGSRLCLQRLPWGPTTCYAVL
jgi:Macrocin-O-methyltransferase (TylF)